MKTADALLLQSYPRSGPPLSAALAAIYVDTYKASRNGKGLLYALTQKLEGWMHKRVARHRRPTDTILEIGAGTLNHLPYEPSFVAYDIIEPFTELYEHNPQLQRIRTVYTDIAHIPAGQRYDRIISVATLEHVASLPQCVATAGLLLKEGGIFQAGIPSEGGALWGIMWRASVGLSFRLRTGLDYGDLMRHEHLSNALEIIAVTRYFFAKVKMTWSVIPHHHLSLYGYIEASRPRLDRCQLINAA